MNIYLYIVLILVSFQISFSQSPGNNGAITGRVSLEGAVPPVPQLTVHKDVHCCGSTTPSPRLSVGNDNGLKNAVVYLKEVTGGKQLDLTKQVLLDQRECHFEPHVVIVPYGGQLVIRNSDEVLHNVRAYHIDDGRTVFNIAQPIQGQQTSIRPALFDSPGIYHATCDAGHPWMSAFIVVAEHPYYTITDDHGEFILENVPPGTYQLRVWHGGVHIRESRSSGSEVIKYFYEEPYAVSEEIHVKPGVTTEADFRINFR
jgi:plastocyanin